MSKRVAILTGGGDVPGLNMCIKSLVYQLIDSTYEPIGVRKGWQGMINYNPADPSAYSEHFIELTKNMVRSIDRTPGSFLHSSRLDPRKLGPELVPEFMDAKDLEYHDSTDHILQVITALGFQAVIVLGDDDMLDFAAHLSQEGAPVVAIPKTIHNNILGTDYTLGFSTGLARGVSLIHELRALAGSREQILVVETFAAQSGYSTLLMSWLAGADRTIIPEVEYDPERLAYLLLQDKNQTPANYAVLVATDGSQPVPGKLYKYAELFSEPVGNADLPLDFRGNGMLGSGLIAAKLLSHICGEEVFTQPLTYMLRSGSPDGQDLLGAANFALTAVHLINQGRFGRMTAFVQEKMWTDVDLEVVLGDAKTIDIAKWYDQERYVPKLSLIWSA